MSANSPRRPSAPSDNEQLIFQWVKMEGKTQSWVAELFGISQSTVSRIIQRVERWQAHALEREGGRLDHTERVRYQRWLTSERNEQIIASCLRIAENLERGVDGTRSTTLYPQRSPTEETKVRTEHFVVDRTGTVCRFLRLAHKIGMDQLKLAQLAPPPLPNPLTPEELANQERDAAAIQADFAAAQRRSSEEARRVCEAERNTPNELSAPSTTPPDDSSELRRLQELEAAEREQLARELAAKVGRSGPDRPESPTDADSSDSPTSSLEPKTLNSPASSPENLELETSNSDLHNLHNMNTPETTPTPDASCTCAPSPAPKKKSKPRITRRSTWQAPPQSESITPDSNTNNRHPRTSRRPKRTKTPPIALG